MRTTRRWRVGFMVVVMPLLAGCAAAGVSQRDIDDVMAWAAVTLPSSGAPGFQGSGAGLLTEEAGFVGAVGIGSVPAGDWTVHVACREAESVSFDVDTIDGTRLGSISVDCGIPAALPVLTSEEGLMIGVRSKEAAGWAAAIVKEG